MANGKSTMAQDGWTPMEKGWMSRPGGPEKVQGGYVPTSSQTVAPPPSGGSAVKPASK